MNATLRISKEVRLIFWTWIAVVALALPPLFTSDWYRIGSLGGGIGFVIGIPLLAVIPIGSELEEGTLSLLLSQPITRIQIWLQKFAVSSIAVVTSSLAFALAYRTTVLTPVTGLAVLWVVAALCAAPYCALIARSVRGALALNLIGFALVLLTSQLFSWARLEVVVTLWAVLMLALGIRKMARFELTTGPVGGDLLTVGPSFRLLRIRRAGVVTNFIRKELGLLRPLWLISLSFVVIFTVLGIWYRPARYALSANFALAVVYQTLSVLLAGSLSVGEEKLSGMHPWHLTLPMSTSQQWLLKLVIAISSSIVCVVAIPSLLTVVLQLDTPSIASIFFYAVSVALLTLVVFWSACFMTGTVRAILLSVVVLFVLTSVAGVGMSSRVFYYPLAFGQVIVPTLALALVQSYRMFRVQPPQTAASLLRQLLPLAATAFAFSLLTAFLITGQR